MRLLSRFYRDSTGSLIKKGTFGQGFLTGVGVVESGLPLLPVDEDGFVE